MKRCWVIFMCVLLFCLSAGAQAAPCLSVGSYTASHETVEIAVALKGNTGFVSYQMDVVYDAAFLQPIDLKGGLGGTPTYNLQGSNAGESCVKVAYASMGSVKDDGVLFTIRFQVKDALAPGQSTLLRLKAVRLFSEDGTDIKTAVEDGTIAVPPAPPASGGSTRADESTTAPPGPSAAQSSAAAPGSRPATQTGSADETDIASQTSGPVSSPAATTPTGSPSAPAAQPTASNSAASAGEPGQTAVPDRPVSSVLAQAPPAQTSSLPVVIFGCIFGGAVVAIGTVLAVLLYRRNKRQSPSDESSNGQ